MAEEKTEDSSFEDAFDEFANAVTVKADSEIIDPIEVNDDKMDGKEENAIQEEPKAAQESAEPKGDLWADVKQEARQAYEEAVRRAEEYEHRHRSDAGRLSAMQKKVNDLERLAKQPQTQPPKEVSSKRWQAFAEEYPDIAGAFDERISALKGEVQTELSSSLKPVEEMKREQFLRSQYAALEAAHPDWRKVAASKQFRDWASRQPESVQQMVRSEEAADAAFLLNSYKAAIGSAPKPTTEAPARQESQQVANLTARRRRQLRQAQSVQGRSAPPKPVPADDYEAAFDAYARQIERRNRA